MNVEVCLMWPRLWLGSIARSEPQDPAAIKAAYQGSDILEP